MKLKATRKQIKEGAYYIIGSGYCTMDYLLRYEEPFSYCCGIYGWSCDNYLIKNNYFGEVIISTGYNYIDSKNVKDSRFNYEIIKKYEQQAREVISGDYTMSYEEKKEIVTHLLDSCIKEIIGE